MLMSRTRKIPTKRGGSLSYAAFIIPESAVERIGEGIGRIFTACYSGQPPSELKYRRIKKQPRLLQCIGTELAALIRATPSCAIIGLFVPQDGFFQERVRSIKAIAEYNGEEPNEAELKEATSSSSVEQAVGKTANRVAHTLACCIASYVAPRTKCDYIFRSYIKGR